MALKAIAAKLSEIAAQIGLRARSPAAFPDARLKEAEERLYERFCALVAPLEERQMNIERTLRSHATKIAEFKTCVAELECKASVRDVPSLQQFNRLVSTVDRKASVNKVPTLVQFSELQDLLEHKIDAHLVPSLSQFKELSATVEQKADRNDVPSASELKAILSDLRLKADTSDTAATVSKSGANKQGEKEDPAEIRKTVDYEERALAMERKLAFLAVRQKKIADSVDHLMEEVTVEEEVTPCFFPPAPCDAWAGMADPSVVWAASGGHRYAPGRWPGAVPRPPQHLEHGPVMAMAAAAAKATLASQS